MPAGKEGKVTLTVKVLEGAKKSNGGPGKVVNGGDTTTVQVGNDTEYHVEEVENPVPEEPHKQEVAPYEGTGELGGVQVGDEITYEITYRNYKSVAADVTIKDTLDKNVEFVSASNGGTVRRGRHTVTWTLTDVPAGKEGKVTLTVKVLETAQQSNGGPGKVVNGGETTTVQVGNDTEYHVEEVENPVPEEPHKKEILPYEGIGELGGVKVGDEITYEISYKNYKSVAADVTIKDKLDANVEFVSASDGAYDEAAYGQLDDQGYTGRRERQGHPDRQGAGRRADVHRPGQGRERRRIHHGEGWQRLRIPCGRGREPRDIAETTITKIWDDGAYSDLLRPETLTLHLLANGAEYATFVIGADGKVTMTEAAQSDAGEAEAPAEEDSHCRL